MLLIIMYYVRTTQCTQYLLGITSKSISVFTILDMYYFYFFDWFVFCQGYGCSE